MQVVLNELTELTESELCAVAGGGNAFGHDKANHKVDNIHIKVNYDPVTNIYQIVYVDNSLGLTV
jgi:hypothetical protein